MLKKLSSLLEINADQAPSRLDIDWPSSEKYDIWVKRDDLLHPIISGNKWRKLKYALLAIYQQKQTSIVSFGGGHSNHLHALAYACHKLNIQLSAIVRGDYSRNPTPMLKDIAAWGTDIYYVDKKTYQKRDEPDYLAQLKQRFKQAIIIPEGGSQAAALEGVGEIISQLTDSFDYIIAPVGSGGTLAGLIATSSVARIVGIGVLKGQGYLEQQVTKLLPCSNTNHNWEILHQYHFGGYAKQPVELTAFCAQFTEQTKIPIEPVYSGKLFFAAKDLIQKQAFPLNSRILLLHTGGLQGARSC